MLNKENKSKLKNFLISSAAFIVGDSLGCYSSHLFTFLYKKDIFPSVLMKELLETEFTHFERTGTLDIICKDAVRLAIKRKADFLDLLIFCAIHGLEYDLNQNFRYQAIQLYNFNEERGLPYEYCNDKKIAVRLDCSSEHNIQELAGIVRGVIWYLTGKKKLCGCHPNYWLVSGSQNIHDCYWEMDAQFYFTEEINLPRKDMELKGRSGFKDGILLGRECRRCKYFKVNEVNKVHSYGSCEYKYEDICRIILLPPFGDSVACMHYDKVLVNSEEERILLNA